METLSGTCVKGTYILVLHLPEEKKIEIGQLGTFRFSKGFYAYVGSAFGEGGLEQRLSHHLQISSKPHWHIDYLRQYSHVVEIWTVKSSEKLEHVWAELLKKMPGGNFFLNGFGSSDCKCVSHLFYFSNLPLFQNFTELAKRNMKNKTYEIERVIV
jgi:Uri superfamily endonuclease